MPKDKHSFALQLRAAYLSMHRQTNLFLSPFGITADQFTCLVILNQTDGLTQQQIVQQASSDPNTIRAILVLLEKRGLLVRHPHPTDKRARLVRLTSEGQDRLKQLIEAVAPVQQALLSIFEQIDANTFFTGLKLTVNSMKTMQSTPE